jgi:Zn-dependent protease
VNFHNLRRPKQDMVWVAAAGAAANLLLAFGFSLLLRGLIVSDALWGIPSLRYVLQPLLLMLRFGVVINCALAVFNLIPLPPLDGGRILTGLLPWKAAYSYSKLEPYGFFILLGLLLTRLLDWIVGPPMAFLLRLFLGETLLM